jgi:hypothetical protein
MIQIEYLPFILTGLGLTASIFYYASVLRNANKTQQMQLETRQAQLFMQILNQFNQPTMVEAKIFYADLEINSLEDYMNLWNDHETNKLLRYWGGYAEGIGVLVRENYLDIKVIAGLMGGMIKASWENQAQYVLEMREKYNSPRAWIEWEYLYNALMKYAEEHPERGIKGVESESIFGSLDRP